MRRGLAPALLAAAIAAAPAGAVRGGIAAPKAVVPALPGGDHVFPVVAAVPATDNFGAVRADVTYHHGDDVFVPQGTPVVAVGDGVVAVAGWNPVGGLRLWLRDAAGNRFYYAHLERLAPGIHAGARVWAGRLLGRVGRTGDAEAGPAHLHFEVHPAPLLALGYDGAVDPHPFLERWTHLSRPRPPRASTGAPVVLLGAHDIASGG